MRRQVKPRSARGRTAVVEGGLPQPNVVSGNARAASLVELLRHPFIHSMLIHAFLKSSLPPRNHAVPRGFCATVLCDAMETDWLADDAVNCEPVSASKFPANREINREFRRNSAIQPRFARLINGREFNSLQPNSLRDRTGNFQMRIREFFLRNRELNCVPTQPGSPWACPMSQVARGALQGRRAPPPPLRSKGSLAMIFKLAEAAVKSWRRLDGHNQLPKSSSGGSPTGSRKAQFSSNRCRLIPSATNNSSLAPTQICYFSSTRRV